MARIQVVIDESERERFRAQARADGMSLSEWLRDAGRRRLVARTPPRLATERDLRDFFSQLDAERDAKFGSAPEDDWDYVKQSLARDLDAELDPLGFDR
jgi:hypothetical protein